jgi:hypothetical protein
MDATEAQKWIDAGDRRILLISGEEAKVTVAQKLLAPASSIPIPALPGFIASDYFKEDTKADGVRIWSLGSNFKNHFLGKAEDASEAADIKISTLVEASLDAPIVAELGTACEITLGQFFHVLSQQGYGEESGPLLVNGWANIAYIRDAAGVLWAVNARWRAAYGGWRVGASSVGDPRRWLGGPRVLSR